MPSISITKMRDQNGKPVSKRKQDLIAKSLLKALAKFNLSHAEVKSR